MQVMTRRARPRASGEFILAERKRYETIMRDAGMTVERNRAHRRYMLKEAQSVQLIAAGRIVLWLFCSRAMKKPSRPRRSGHIQWRGLLGGNKDARHKAKVTSPEESRAPA